MTLPVTTSWLALFFIKHICPPKLTNMPITSTVHYSTRNRNWLVGKKIVVWLCHSSPVVVVVLLDKGHLSVLHCMVRRGSIFLEPGFNGIRQMCWMDLFWDASAQAVGPSNSQQKWRVLRDELEGCFQNFFCSVLCPEHFFTRAEDLLLLNSMYCQHERVLL